MSLEQLRERVSIGINDAFREEVSLEMQRRSTFMGGIEQAKVLRGPSTAQHDSASLGRVLQVISRSPDKLAPGLEWTHFYSSASHSFANG